jgi:fructose-bisphosphate aldolase, class I
MTERTKEILSWYGSDNPGTLTNLARLLNHGRLGGTGKLVILPVDQGFEHGPARSFAANPPAYDPRYHFELAIEAGCNAYAAPLGFLEAGAREFAGEIPLILKVNDHDALLDEADPTQALTSSVQDALRLGCVAIGFTIYPGSAKRFEMYEQIRAYAAEAKRCGLVVVIWSYARGSGVSTAGETAIDVIAYAAQIAAQLGAHIIKVKLPTEHIEQQAAKEVYQKMQIPIATLIDRVRHVVQCTFNGRRIVIFSGGATHTDESLFQEVRAIQGGGGFGSIIGRNSFQRSKPDALKLLDSIMKIYSLPTTE